MAEASGNAGVAQASLPGPACRINDLAEDILLRVLSHMDALQVVRTSLLSRRWWGLWRSVNRINATHEEFDGVDDDDGEREATFRAFIGRFLMLRNRWTLDVFNLRVLVPDGENIDYDAESVDANLWISHALQCNATSISIHVADCEAKMHLNSSVFASKCFLKSLELTYVVLFRGFFENLQKGCTKLERLRLYHCAIGDSVICSQTLKVFTMDSECYNAYFKMFTISIPGIVYLDY